MSEILGRRCTNALQTFCFCWECCIRKSWGELTVKLNTLSFEHVLYICIPHRYQTMFHFYHCCQPVVIWTGVDIRTNLEWIEINHIRVCWHNFCTKVFLSFLIHSHFTLLLSNFGAGTFTYSFAFILVHYLFAPTCYWGLLIGPPQRRQSE